MIILYLEREVTDAVAGDSWRIALGVIDAARLHMQIGNAVWEPSTAEARQFKAALQASIFRIRRPGRAKEGRRGFGTVAVGVEALGDHDFIFIEVVDRRLYLSLEDARMLAEGLSRTLAGQRPGDSVQQLLIRPDWGFERDPGW